MVVEVYTTVVFGEIIVDCQGYSNFICNNDGDCVDADIEIMTAQSAVVLLPREIIPVAIAISVTRGCN